MVSRAAGGVRVWTGASCSCRAMNTTDARVLREEIEAPADSGNDTSAPLMGKPSSQKKVGGGVPSRRGGAFVCVHSSLPAAVMGFSRVHIITALAPSARATRRCPGGNLLSTSTRASHDPLFSPTWPRHGCSLAPLPPTTHTRTAQCMHAMCQSHPGPFLTAEDTRWTQAARPVFRRQRGAASDPVLLRLRADK